ncbi:hypothetical protein GQ600_6872 [Phytophthora cactorum]|nr:hypothetical protein GQ600_6872 [Phytophthora cactorum]
MSTSTMSEDRVRTQMPYAAYAWYTT